MSGRSVAAYASTASTFHSSDAFPRHDNHSNLERVPPCSSDCELHRMGRSPIGTQAPNATRVLSPGLPARGAKSLGVNWAKRRTENRWRGKSRRNCAILFGGRVLLTFFAACAPCGLCSGRLTGFLVDAARESSDSAATRASSTGYESPTSLTCAARDSRE